MTKKWFAHNYDHFGACGWYFPTFAKAVEYLRDQRENNARNCVGPYASCVVDQRQYIDGPGGRLDHATLAPLFK